MSSEYIAIIILAFIVGWALQDIINLKKEMKEVSYKINRSLFHALYDENGRERYKRND